MKNSFTAQWKSRLPLLHWASSPLDPILHPSMWRLRLLGLGTMLGQPLFGWIWTSIYRQPYESIWMRCLMGALAGVLMLPLINKNLSAIKTQAFFSVIAWIEFPFFFSWMYLQNGGNPVWVASVCSMILIYYHLTDWRIATAGVLTGAMTAWMASSWLADPVLINSTEHATNAVVIAFSWGCALLLGLSSADLRREHLSSTLATIGIMAHELRTPLSTAALLGDAIQMEVRRHTDNAGAPHIEKLAIKLHTLVRHMNHQIDTQIANAKLRDLPRHAVLVSAGKLVSDVVANYPYPASRQRLCVRVLIHDDFAFRSSSEQFSQVLDNLIKNAFYSLMAADSRYPVGALRIEISKSGRVGKILVQDEGMGIDPAMLQQIFKPFFSSNRGTGHGLGLAFCQRVVQSAGGTISVKSKYAVGASFSIELPTAT